MIHTGNPNSLSIVKIIGSNQLSVKEMMTALGLKGRDNFLNLHLMPAIADGYVSLLYATPARNTS